MNILLPVDGSEYSDSAVDSVAGRPWPAGTAVRVLHVLPSAGLVARAYVTPAPAMAMPSSLAWPAELLDVQTRLTERGQALVARTAEQLRSAGLAVEHELGEGDPREVIVARAQEWPADLIVMGSHGYSGLKRLLLGSVAQSVSVHAPCSVEITRKRDPAAL